MRRRVRLSRCRRLKLGKRESRVDLCIEPLRFNQLRALIGREAPELDSRKAPTRSHILGSFHLSFHPPATVLSPDRQSTASAKSVVASLSPQKANGPEKPPRCNFSGPFDRLAEVSARSRYVIPNPVQVSDYGILIQCSGDSQRHLACRLLQMSGKARPREARAPLAAYSWQVRFRM
jgi:hypothetical protein